MTDDGGITWTPQETQGAVTLFDVFFSDTSTGWAVGNAGAIFQTSNGGLQWIDRTLPCTSTCTKLTDLLKVRFTDPQTGWIVGNGVWSIGALTAVLPGLSRVQSQRPRYSAFRSLLGRRAGPAGKRDDRSSESRALISGSKFEVRSSKFS